MDTEKEIAAIHERNAKVTLDKRWETSWTRRASILLVTYAAAYVLLRQIGAGEPALGAFVPCLGYLLSTLSLPFIRSVWEEWSL